MFTEPIIPKRPPSPDTPARSIRHLPPDIDRPAYFLALALGTTQAEEVESVVTRKHQNGAVEHLIRLSEPLRIKGRIDCDALAIHLIIGGEGPNTCWWFDNHAEAENIWNDEE